MCVKIVKFFFQLIPLELGELLSKKEKLCLIRHFFTFDLTV